jgi:uncharacterized membrane protein
MVEQSIHEFVYWLQLAVEALSAAIIAVGVAVAVIAYAREMLRRTDRDYVAIRLALARQLVIALEFQLAADVLATAISPSWDQIGKLAAIAAIRTALNHFLIREMAMEERRERELRGQPPADDLSR